MNDTYYLLFVNININISKNNIIIIIIFFIEKFMDFHCKEFFYFYLM